MEHKKEIENLANDFQKCQEILVAIGDVNRQHMIVEMLRTGRCSGIRINEIIASTNLSKPTVSRHLKILKDAGLLKMRQEGTKHYYYFDPEPESMELLMDVFSRTMQITSSLPDRSGEQ